MYVAASIAKAIQNDTTNIVRDNQIGTLNYMSPEAILDTNNDVDRTKMKMKVFSTPFLRFRV